LDYPLSLTFKLLALAPQAYTRDAKGALKFYVKQQLFKLKEAVTVFADDAQTQPLYTMKADRILDFNARYDFADMSGGPVGNVRRQGRRSIWKAHYEVYDGETQTHTIQEENPWVRVLEAILGQIPILGFFAVMLLNPTFLVKRMDGTLLLKVKKVPAFFEGKFEITSETALDATEETRVLLAVLMMSLLERARG
jgi:hypothetical protein